MPQEATQFEILDRVDVGGMAEIFRARNLSSGQIMAIKRILPQLARQTNFVSMFIDEAAVSMNLHHPNIVRVDQIGLMDDALFLSMEFVNGINLRELLNFSNQYKFSIPIHEALRIAILVLDGLDYAHHCCNENGEPLNLIHRDVSPPNILIGYNGDVKITDFGLVKSKTQVSKTVPGLIKGKFSYLSPEAAYGESIDHRSDIYAVGIILWEMLTSQPLFNDPVEMKILDLVRKSIVPPIAQFNPKVTPELEAIIMKGLARNRKDRYSTAAEFADALRGYLKKLGNPKSDIGNIIAQIKPPMYSDEDDEVVGASAPEGASAADDELKPHTKSSLIPIEKIRKQAENSTLDLDKTVENSVLQADLAATMGLDIQVSEDDSSDSSDSIKNADIVDANSDDVNESGISKGNQVVIIALIFILILVLSAIFFYLGN